jgi:hypothetical protein
MDGRQTMDLAAVLNLPRSMPVPPSSNARQSRFLLTPKSVGARQQNVIKIYDFLPFLGLSKYEYIIFLAILYCIHIVFMSW